MENQTELPGAGTPAETPAGLAVKIVGVGTAGIAMLSALNPVEFAAAQLVAINTDAGPFAACPAPVKIQLENKLLRGLGSGGDPDRGRALAEEQFSTLKSACQGASVVFILAGLGGGAGSGISPVLARAAREAGALVLAFVTLPFACEGNRRESQAQQGLEQLKAAADGVICLPSQRIFKLVDENTCVLEAFRIIDRFVIEGVRGLWHLLTRPGLIQIHFDDLRTLLRERHTECAFAFVEATGAGRSREVVENILSHPLLDDGRALAESDAVLVSLTAGTDLSMAEINRVIDLVKRQCSQAQIIMGAALDPAMEDKLCVTVIAARRELASTGASARTETRTAGPGTGGGETVVARPSRGRKSGNKPIQTQLPLTIISKGRFDKSEPTKHNGEDLDVPTFIRRGISLN
jgi:cell division protein FtsZ